MKKTALDVSVKRRRMLVTPGNITPSEGLPGLGLLQARLLVHSALMLSACTKAGIYISAECGVNFGHG